MLDANGKDLAEYTLGLEHNTISRVLRDPQTYHETGRRVYSLTTAASNALNNRLSLVDLDRVIGDESRAALSAGSDAPDYHQDNSDKDHPAGTTTVPTFKIVQTRGRRSAVRRCARWCLGRVMSGNRVGHQNGIRLHERAADSHAQA